MSEQDTLRSSTAVGLGMSEREVRIVIPDEVSFCDLGVTRLPDGALAFDLDLVERICHANGVDTDAFDPQSPEGEATTCNFLLGWYERAVAGGEPPDPVMEDLFAEVLAEERAGQHVSLAPGRA